MDRCFDIVYMNDLKNIPDMNNSGDPLNFSIDDI